MAAMTEVIEDDEGGTPMSQHVQVLAQGIRDEFQPLVDTYGTDCVVSLMPLVVNILEQLDSALADNKDYVTALEETNEENQQLSREYKKEKQRRREIEEKSMRMEDFHDLELRKLRGETSSMALVNRNQDSKLGSQKEQIERLEERQEAIRREKNELHDKHIELIKSHQAQINKLNFAIKEARSRVHSTEEFSSGSPSNPAGYHDFTSPPKGGNQNKKRQLPIAPRKKPRSASAGSGEGEEELLLLATTPFQRPDSPEFLQGHGEEVTYDPNHMSLFAEQQKLVEVEDERLSDGTLEDDEDPSLGLMEGEDFRPNEDSLLLEFQQAAGMDQILEENMTLTSEKNDLTREVDELLAKYRETEADRMTTLNSLNSMTEEKSKLLSKIGDMETDTKKLRADLEAEREKGMIQLEGEVIEGPDGNKLTRLELTRVLRERKEYKEKYLSLLEQIRMSDELSLFKSKNKKSRWVDYFAALFSPAKRRQLEMNLSDAIPRRPILSRGSLTMGGGGADEEDGGFPQAGDTGYRSTGIIPVLKKTGKRQDEVYMTSVSWVIPTMDHQILEDASLHPQPNTPSINTCRPMGYQEEGAKILCASSVNPATFIEDCRTAISVDKESMNGCQGIPKPDASISLIWIVTGVPNLTKVSVIDVAAVGDVLDTFPVCASPIYCIASVPEFNSRDPDVMACLKPSSSSSIGASSADLLAESSSDRPSSRQATMWLGSDSGVLYVHSSVSQWRKCIHADKLPAAIVAITYFLGKTFVLMQNSKLAIFRRFQDGEWDWDNYSMMLLTVNREFHASAMAAVKYNVWCAVGNTIFVVQSLQLKMEATFQVNQNKNAVVSIMLPVGMGVWIAFKMDSVLRLYNASSFALMQNLDIAPSIHRILVFGSEKTSRHMPIQVSTMVAAHSALWVGTENGVLVSYPFSAPAVVAEESGWEMIKEAEVGGQVVPEPFDVRTEEGLEAGAFLEGGLEASHDSGRSSGERSLSHSVTESSPSKSARTTEGFNPFCVVDQVELSIHCHINAVKCLLSVPGIVPMDLSLVEPLGGVYIGSGDAAQSKPTLFVVSCGEGHLDMRTADKVLQTLQAQEDGQSGLPSPATVISEKNYVMVWDINN